MYLNMQIRNLFFQKAIAYSHQLYQKSLMNGMKQMYRQDRENLQKMLKQYGNYNFDKETSPISFNWFHSFEEWQWAILSPWIVSTITIVSVAWRVRWFIAEIPSNLMLYITTTRSLFFEKIRRTLLSEYECTVQSVRDKNSTNSPFFWIWQPSV